MARPAAKREPRRDTREEIVLAALDCFGNRGIGATGLDEIAEQAGLSRPTIYYHFEGKRDLVLEVLVRRGAQLHEMISQEIAYKPATVDLIVLANQRAIELTLQDSVARQLASSESEHLTAELLESDAMRPIHEAFWLPLLRAAAEAGELRTDLDFHQIITWMVFLQFSLVSLGSEFALLEPARLHATLDAFLGPALAAT
jgi:AcrR family transcriptional regulator